MSETFNFINMATALAAAGILAGFVQVSGRAKQFVKALDKALPF